jgi:hypothetical protein
VAGRWAGWSLRPSDHVEGTDDALVVELDLAGFARKTSLRQHGPSGHHPRATHGEGTQEPRRDELANWIVKGLMIMGHAPAIEAALRLDETISITDEQRRQVANLLVQHRVSPAGVHQAALRGRPS